MEAAAKRTLPVKVKHFNGKVEYLEDEKLAALCKEQKQLRGKLMGSSWAGPDMQQKNKGLNGTD